MPLTLQQRQLRCKGITGSQIAILAGLSPWGSAVEVWREKVEGPGHDSGPEVGPHMERGIFFEDACLRWYVHRTGRAAVPTKTIVHPEHPLVIATPDAVSLDPSVPGERPVGDGRIQWSPGDIVVEVKCPSWRTARAWGEEGSDEIPRYYYPQVIWEMAVTGLRHAHVVAYFGDQLRIYNVPWNQDIFDRLREVAEDFWHTHVVAGVPPFPDASQAYADHLAELYPQASAPLMKADGDTQIAMAAAQAKDAEENIRAHARRLEEAKNILKMRIGSARGIEGGFGRITWSNNKDSERTDWEAVAKAAGATDELIRSHTINKPGPRVFRANWAATAGATS